MIIAIALAALANQAPSELARYLGNGDKSYRAEVVSTDGMERRLTMTSQTWQGAAWKHTILYRNNPGSPAKTAILYITGDGPRANDGRDLQRLSAVTNLPVAMLFDIPNQPLYDMREDDLIAHTFERFLETGDAAWPLLFPMTKAALRAMDAVQQIDPSVKQFVVTGASKRGWTTWLVGASGDPRVKGIAPMVYDNLNIPAQMKHQMALWGRYSPQIEDYTRRGLQAKLATAEGQRLAAMVDPYSYRSGIRMPTLVVTGSNDPYWAADATSNYWDNLRQPKWSSVVPNAGHNLGSGVQAAFAIGAFARMVDGQLKFPSLRVDPVRNGWRVRSDGVPATRVLLWRAESERAEYAEAKWTSSEISLEDKAHVDLVMPLEPVASRYVARFAEVRYRTPTGLFSLTSRIRIDPPVKSKL